MLHTSNIKTMQGNYFSWLRIFTFYIIVVGLSLPFNLNFFHLDFSNYTYLSNNLGYIPAAFGTLVGYILFNRFLHPSKKIIRIFGNSPVYSLLFCLTPLLFFTFLKIPQKNDADPLLFAFIYSSINLLYAIGEELAWRNYLQNELRPLPDWPRFLLIGTMWWLWHGRFNTMFDIFVFPVIVIISSIGLCKLAEITKSSLFSAGAHLLVILLTNTEGNFNNKLIAACLTIVVWVPLLKKLTKNTAEIEYKTADDKSILN